MDMRELKALEIAARSKVVFHLGRWLVPSQTTNAVYAVTLSPVSCNCEDFQLRALPCKHVIAARLVAARDGDAEAPPLVVDEVPKRKTYQQDWPKYDRAQQTEKDRFQELLFQIVQGVVEPPSAKTGRKRTAMKDMVVAACLKVFTTFSSRRFACDLRDAHERGFVSKLMNSISACHYLDDDKMTPVLLNLIERAAMPLVGVEEKFAPDSTGFSSSRFVRWFDEKYGKERSGRTWVKAHAMVGTKTNIITTAIIEGPNTSDCPQFKPLLETTIANGFKPTDVLADKAYLSKENLELVEKNGGTAYIPFKVNSQSGEVGSIWEKMYGYFQFRREDFLRHYHQRSNVESTFSMVKAKFQDSVRSKSDTAMKNEVLAKFLCHNIVVIHQSIIELGIDPVFWPEPEEVGDGPRDILPLRLKRNDVK